MHELPASRNRSKSLKIDAIRFVAAFWVLMFHFKPPMFKELLPHQLAFVGGALWSGLTILFAGPAAVIVFFVISGYCIHNAYHKEVALKVVNYYASRFIRIGLPLVILLLLIEPLPTGQDYVGSVLWSLYCEMVYYAIYPLLRPRFRYIGDMIVFATLAAALMVAVVRLFGHPACQQCVFQTYGVPGTALLYGAGWILGCFIAEVQRNASLFDVRGNYSRITVLMKHTLDAAVARMTPHLIALRVAVALGGALTMVLMSESSLKPKMIPLINADVTLPIFQFLAAVWIATETVTPSDAKLWSKLATLGAWSYSLYLCHKLAWSLLEMTSFDQNGRFTWFVEVPLALLISYTFYRLIEKPSHLIAQRLRRYTPATAPKAPAP